MMSFRVLLFAALFGGSLHAATLPGFRIETVAQAPGFVSSVVSDSRGTIWLTTTDGWIHRVDGNQTTKVAALPTHAGGNGGLLGMALLGDETAVVHYTTWDGEAGEFARVLDDVVSRVDLRTGAETVLHTFVCNINYRPSGVSSEHHGGNLTVAPDGSVFLGIGEYGARIIAQYPEWNAGKVWRVAPDGTATQYALGLRNPYDLAWDPDLGRIVIADNGAHGGDKIHIVTEGDNLGWPSPPPIPGASRPVYEFPATVAPTGFVRLDGANPLLRRGYLLGAFVTRAVYYFRSITPETTSEPIALVDGLDEFVIDVTQARNARSIACAFRGAATATATATSTGATSWPRSKRSMTATRIR
jgi:glucose/arabinose dehydrogenase